MSVGIIELHYKQVLPESVMIQICFTCLPQTSWHLHSLATLGKERRENLSHSQEGVLWIHFLGQKDKRELFCWVYQWFNPDTAYFWQNTRLTVLCNFLEALCLRRADTVICASSCPSPATHTQHHSWALRGALCLIVGLMHTLMAYWYWFQHGEYLRNLIPQSSSAFFRFWEEVNPCPSLLQGGPKLLSAWATGVRSWSESNRVVKCSDFGN